jgi:predicted nucleotidyltransferase
VDERLDSGEKNGENMANKWAVPDLPPEVQKVLDEFVFAARQAFSEQLTSIVLFGSAAEGKLRPASDVNLLIILSAFERKRSFLAVLCRRDATARDAAILPAG